MYQLDGKIPNVALMRLAAHHRGRGDSVELRKTGQPDRTFADLGDPPDRVYASAIFTKTRPVVERLLRSFPDAVVGGTGWDVARRLEDFGVETKQQDYSDYPKWRQSIGFTQRGCRLKCGFCVVPKKEGAVAEAATIREIWRGDPWPRELILLDNDFFGQPAWRARVQEIREGGFKVSFNQGINARFLDDEAAEAIASVEYRDDGMTVRRIYTAWDNRKDEHRLFAGLGRLVKYGVKPDHIMVYVLVGYWPGETEEDRLYRVMRLREFGARPYPMPYVRTSELVGFQRWVVGAYDKRIPWREWRAANCRPEQLGNRSRQMTLPVVDGCAFSSALPISPSVNANGKAAKALPLLILILVGVIGFEPTTSWSRTKNGPASHHVYCESINANGPIFQARNSPLPNSNRPPKPTPNQSRIGRVSAARATAPSAPAPRQEGVPS